jgi:hypothetical protein
MRELTTDEVAELREMADRLAEIIDDAGLKNISVTRHSGPAKHTDIHVQADWHPAHVPVGTIDGYSLWARWDHEGCDDVSYIHAECSR